MSLFTACPGKNAVLTSNDLRCHWYAINAKLILKLAMAHVGEYFGTPFISHAVF